MISWSSSQSIYKPCLNSQITKTCKADFLFAIVTIHNQDLTVKTLKRFQNNCVCLKLCADLLASWVTFPCSCLTYYTLLHPFHSSLCSLLCPLNTDVANWGSERERISQHPSPPPPPPLPLHRGLLHMKGTVQGQWMAGGVCAMRGPQTQTQHNTQLHRPPQLCWNVTCFEF